MQLSETVVRNYEGFSNQGKSVATSTLILYNFRRAFHVLKLNLIMCSGQSSQVSQNMALKKKQQHTWSSRLVQCSGCCWTIQLFLLQSITPFCSECCMLRLSSEEHFALLVLLKRKKSPKSYADVNKPASCSYQHTCFASRWEILLSENPRNFQKI